MKVYVAVLLALYACASAAPPALKLDNRNTRITGGQAATRNQFPYQISLEWGLLGIYQHICGGSIVSPTWVVSAAHCITEIPNIGNFRVTAGILNLGESVATRQQIIVAQTVVHPDYAGGVNPNDISLLRLTSALTYNDGVQPIAIPQPYDVATGSAILSGWGSTSTTIIPSMPTTLQTVTIPVLSLQECADALTALFGTSNPLANTNVCTGPLTGGISACSGDSGGPLARNGELIGVVSWGVSPCGTSGAPSVFVQTSNYTSFIQQYVTDLPYSY